MRHVRRPRRGLALPYPTVPEPTLPLPHGTRTQAAAERAAEQEREHDGGDGGGDGGDGGDGVRSGGGVDSEEECGALVSQRIELAPAVASVPASTVPRLRAALAQAPSPRSGISPHISPHGVFTPQASGSPEDRVALAVDSTSHPPALELSIAAADVAAAESACEGAVACRGAFPEPSRIFPL